MSDRLIEEIRKTVERACAAESNVFGYGIWTHHIVRVAHHAVRLAPVFEADSEIVEIAALLHDYASVKDEALYEDHHIHGPVEAGKLLEGLGYPPEKTRAVQRAIAAHRASARPPEGRQTRRPPGGRQTRRGEGRSPEAECLASADALAHIENVPSLLHLAYVRRRQGIDDGASWVRAKLMRSWGKLDPRVRGQAREAYESALQVLGDQEP